MPLAVHAVNKLIANAVSLYRSCVQHTIHISGLLTKVNAVLCHGQFFFLQDKLRTLRSTLAHLSSQGSYKNNPSSQPFSPCTRPTAFELLALFVLLCLCVCVVGLASNSVYGYIVKQC